jgi:integrase
MRLRRRAGQEMKTLDAAGVADLLREANGTELRLPIAVLVGTGMRRGELFGLRWADIDFEAALDDQAVSRDD